ncbi:MAG: hypothetical protein E7625_03645 [Ruminococcaceae bacterium]|nr:hypothetical protein [Oscillospiraceae bacterium]
MNQNPSPMPGVQLRFITDKNPWADGSTIPSLPLPGNLALCLLLVACAAYPLVVTPPQMYTVCLLVALIAALIFVVRSVTVGILSAVLFFGGCLSGGLVGGVYALALMATVGIGAFLISTCRSYALAAVPIAAYLLSLLLCRDPMLAVLSLIAFPAAGILAYNTMQNRPRVSSICLVSIMLGLCAVFGGALVWYRANGTIVFSEVIAAAEALREQIVTIMTGDATLMEALQMTLDTTGTGIEAAALIQSSVELVFNMLPGLLIFALNILAYACQLTCIRTYRGVGMKQLVTHMSQLFVLSVPAAIIYLVCCIASIFSKDFTLTSAVFENLRLILLPGMCLVGVFKLAADLQRGISKIWIVLIIGAALLAPTMLILCVSISGALATLMRPIVAHILLNQPKNDSSDHSDDPS